MAEIIDFDPAASKWMSDFIKTPKAGHYDAFTGTESYDADAETEIERGTEGHAAER